MTRSRSTRAAVGLIAVLSMALSTLPALAAAPMSPHRCGDPGSGGAFEKASPEDLHLDGDALKRATDFAVGRGAESIRIHRFGCLAATGSVDPLYEHVPHYMFSHTKTVVALVTGRAQTLGYLHIDDPIGKYFPKGLGDPAHRAITLRQLLGMTTGLRMNWWGNLFNVMGSQASADSVREALSLPLDHSPGTYWEYNQTPLVLLTHAVELAVGQDFQAFTQSQLFDPLGIPRNSWFWLRDRAGHTYGAYHLWQWPTNVAVQGQLMLNGGVWHGTQLIDRSFVEAMHTGQKDLNPAYGLLTWVNDADHFVKIDLPGKGTRDRQPIASAPRDMYFSWGYRGQHFFVIPSLQLMVSMTGEWMDLPPDGTSWPVSNEQGEGYHELFRLLMRAVTDRHISDPGPWHAQTPRLEFTPDYYSPSGLLHSNYLGPDADPGCTQVGCDGQVAYQGSVSVLQDAGTASVASAGTPSGSGPR